MNHPPMTRTLALAAFALAASASFAGCTGGHGHVHHGPPPPPVYGESEPNDSPFSADFIGGVSSSTHLFVEGHVDAFGPDVYDHFELFAHEPVGVEVYLDAWNPGADVDLCLVDPDTGEVVACYDSPYGSEWGYFTVDWPGKHFVLMVETWHEGTGYTIEILVDPHPLAGQNGPADSPVTGGVRGLSFPEGRPSPVKPEHLRDAPPRQPAPALEQIALRELRGEG